LAESTSSRKVFLIVRLIAAAQKSCGLLRASAARGRQEFELAAKKADSSWEAPDHSSRRCHTVPEYEAVDVIMEDLQRKENMPV